MIGLEIPSPPVEWSSFNIGPLEIRAYALFILTGIVLAILMTRARWIRRGGDPAAIEEIAIWAVPFGIVGGRLYHVISTPGPYFGEGGHPIDALKIWQGGLGIWGAIALGSLGAYIGARRVKVSFATFMDAAAPGILAAQAIGRLGNYFNQELFGRPTDLPWGLAIDPQFRPAGYEQFETFHPTFLYEMIWSTIGVVVLLILDRRLRLRNGRLFWLYVIFYTTGRLFIETVRIDTAVKVWGQRINVWVSIAVLLGAIIAFIVIGRRHRGDPEDAAPARPLADATVKADAKAPATKAGTAKATAAKAAAPKTPAKRATPTGAAAAKRATTKASTASATSKNGPKAAKPDAKKAPK